MEVFVFPIMNVTLFPSTAKPLNVFEPRYVEMIKESVRTGTPVALVFVEDPIIGLSAMDGRSLDGTREIAGYGRLWPAYHCR